MEDEFVFKGWTFPYFYNSHIQSYWRDKYQFVELDLRKKS